MRALIILLLAAIGCTAQTVAARNIDDILNQREVKVPFYRFSKTYLDAVVINMSFGESAIISIMDKDKLKDAQIVQVDVVYTDFPKGMELQELNRQRIRKAQEVRKDLVTDENIQWRLIRQVSCQSEAEAKTLFHGVIIYYRGAQTPQLAYTEKEYYKRILPEKGSSSVKQEQFRQFSDSTVIAVFRRNAQWKNTTIVADATCSMSPYIGQILLWFLYKINTRETSNIVMFNDGDGIPNHFKIIGKTGGIYSKSTSKYDDLLELLDTTTAKGCSGDAQENGVEAILKAQKQYPQSREIIFIADNYADMRDFSLIPQIKIPVRVVLCGTHFGVNRQYLELARKTGGSIHTMEQDLYDLSKIAEGKTFVIGKQAFIIREGKIEPLSRI